MPPVPIEEITADRLVAIAREYGITAEAQGEAVRCTVQDTPFIVTISREYRLLLFWFVIPMQDPNGPPAPVLYQRLNELNQLALSIRFTIPAASPNVLLADYSIPLELYSDDFFPVLAKQFLASVLRVLESEAEDAAEDDSSSYPAASEPPDTEDPNQLQLPLEPEAGSQPHAVEKL